MNSMSGIESNPFFAHEANQQFLKLYCSPSAKNADAWIDYFSSLPFLQVAKKEEFMLLLLKEVVESQSQYPPQKQFLVWLWIAYQISSKNSSNNPESIWHICEMGQIPELHQKKELTIQISFQEYWDLVQLAEQNLWSEKEIYQFTKIIERYDLAYISERCENYGFAPDYCRHPVGIRLITNFVELNELPKELYKIVWNRLKLKDAKYGRAKVLYGRLREIILERMPEAEQTGAAAFGVFKSDFLVCCANCNVRAGSDPQKDKEEVEAFFSREECEKAFLNRDFIQENFVDGVFISESTPTLMLLKILEFYQAHQEAPYCEIVTKKTTDILELKKQNEKLAQYDKTIKSNPMLQFSSSPFFEYWLNCCYNTMALPFYSYGDTAYNRPYNQQWVYNFLSEGKENLKGTPLFKSIKYSFQDGEERADIEIRLHIYYIDFIVNGEAVYQPIFDWDWLKTIKQSAVFFYLLLITVALNDRYDEVEKELEMRFKRVHSYLSDNQIQYIASTFANHICCLSNDACIYNNNNSDCFSEKVSISDPELLLAQLPYVMFQETTTALYYAYWNPVKHQISVFERMNNHKKQRILFQECISQKGFDWKEKSKELLIQAVVPSDFSVKKLCNLPTAVYVKPNFMVRGNNDLPRELTGEQISYESLIFLMKNFSEDNIDRLEFSWPTTLPSHIKQEYEPRFSLVFLKDKEKYGCFVFDDFRGECYALPTQQSKYPSLDNTFEFQWFLRERIFSHYIHPTFYTIESQLEFVFQSMGFPTGALRWSLAVNVSHGRNKYNIDKQLLGGFPMEWAHNGLLEQIYLEDYPTSLNIEDFQGKTETIIITNNSRFKVKTVLKQFFSEKISRLVLNWTDFHVVLLYENGCCMLAALQDKKQSADFCVADVSSYMKVEGKKYPKETFMGRTVPGYLLHKDMSKFRNLLEQLLANIYTPEIILHQFAQYADENPVKPRSYEEICEDFLR